MSQQKNELLANLQISSLLTSLLLVLISAGPLVADGTVEFKGTKTGSTVDTSHILTGCPGTNYGSSSKDYGPSTDSVSIPSNISCPVMSFSTGKMEWDFPDEILAEIPDGVTNPTTATITADPPVAITSKMSGTMRLSESGSETHTFRVDASLLGFDGCTPGFAEQTWTTTIQGSRLMTAEASCPFGVVNIVPGSVVVNDGKVDSFKVEVEAWGHAELGHAIPFGQPGFKGGYYSVGIVTEYEFEAQRDKVEIKNPDPDPADLLTPDDNQAFKADVDYDLVSKDAATLVTKLVHEDPDTGLFGELWVSDRRRITKGSGTIHHDIPAVLLPMSGRVILVSELFEDGNPDNRLLRSNEVIWVIANDYLIDHIEVVQAVQSVSNTIPLVANKSTMVRVFARTKEPVRKPGNNVPMLLRGFRNGRELPNSPLVDMGRSTYIYGTAMRYYWDVSYNFYLPMNWVTAGDLQVIADVNPDRDIDEPDYNNNDDDVSVVFNTKPGMTVRYLPVCVVLEGIGTECPDEGIGSSALMMQRMYPVPDKGINYGPLNRPPFIYTGRMSKWEDAYRFLIQLNREYQLLAAAGNAPDQLTAWIPDIPTEIGGLSDPFWAGRGSRVTVMKDMSVDKPWWNVMTLPHEIGHNLGLRHPNTPDSNDALDSGTDWPYPTATIQEYGWDVAGRRIKVPYHPKPSFIKYDFMSYVADHKMWVSDFHYLKLYNSSLSNPGAPAASPARLGLSRAANGDYEVAIVSGIVQKDNSGAVLDPLLRLMSAVEPMASDPDGNYCLEFRDAGGATLGEHCVELTFRNVELDQDLDQDYFTVRTALPAGTVQVALVHEGAVLASQFASVTAPTVQITAPAGGDQWTGGVPNTVAWTGTDPEGNPLTYSLLYSADGGTSYVPLAADLTITQYNFDPALIAGGANVHFRVLATDGFHTAVADVGPITVVQNPEIDVTGPIDVGEAPIGGHASVSVTIANTGTGPLTIQSITSNTEVFGLETDPSPFTLAAGDTIDVDLLYVPEQVGADAGTLTFASNATNASNLQVAVQGICTDGQDPTLYTDPSTLGIPEITVGEDVIAGVAIENRSHSVLEVEWTLTGNGMEALTTEATLEIDGMGETAIEILCNPAAPGNYEGQLTITSNDPDQPRLEIPIRYTAVEAPVKPSVFPGGVVDAPQGGPTVTMGSIASIYGTNLADTVAVASVVPLPRELGGVKVFVDGVEAPIYFVSPGQINIQIPFEVGDTDTLSVVVVTNGQTAYTTTVSAALYAPAVFMNVAAGEPIVQRNSDGTLVTAGNPATAKEILIVYLTGIGDLTDPPETGEPAQADPLPWASTMPTVTVGGVDARVYYAGLTPYFVGLAQVVIELPETLPEGDSLTLVIHFGDAESREVELPVN